MTTDAVLPGVGLNDFYAYMPAHSYIYAPTREMWPGASVNARVPPIPMPSGKTIAPSTWLDRHRPVEQMTWAPGLPTLIGKPLDLGRWLDRAMWRHLFQPLSTADHRIGE